MIAVKTFAQVREIVGKSDWHVEVSSQLTVSELTEKLIIQDARWKQALAGQVLVAVNQTMRDLSYRVQDNDEVAFFPPVTGG
ncbi:MoaD/ThiS family protein [Salinimonas chungwhensis]|uniref:MoaD/ThiS family protein n=1 Tax=Salinimonas chungwhensis TaxID=265425 RepID=UPI000362F0B9|nr:MoaD/ThiS family protein [Salinimonas chungwhensis]